MDDGDGGVVDEDEDAFAAVSCSDAEVVHAAGSAETDFSVDGDVVVSNPVVVAVAVAGEMDAVADAFLNDAGGEAIAKALSPIKHRWSGQWRQAVLAKDKAKKESLESFRSDVLGYRNAWQFLSQIVDYQDPELHLSLIHI